MEGTRSRNPIEAHPLVEWWLRQEERVRLNQPWDSFPALTQWQYVFTLVLAKFTRDGGSVTKWQAIEEAERLYMDITYQYVFSEHVGAPDLQGRVVKEYRLRYPSLITLGIVRVKHLRIVDERTPVYKISQRGIEVADLLVKHGFFFKRIRTRN